MILDLRLRISFCHNYEMNQLLSAFKVIGLKTKDSNPVIIFSKNLKLEHSCSDNFYLRDGGAKKSKRERPHRIDAAVMQFKAKNLVLHRGRVFLSVFSVGDCW